MTVVVAVKCADGVVLATDSQGTAHVPGNLPVKVESRKILCLGKHIVYGGTGGEGAGQRIHGALTAHAAKMGATRSPDEIADVIRRAVNPIQQEIRAEWVDLPNTQPESWGGIFCGWSRDGPWIWEVDLHGPSQFKEPFASTGSGYALAHVALAGVAHYDVATQSLAGAKAIAYRAIENTCQVSGYGVGPPVQVAVVSASGIEEFYDGDEGHTELAEFVDLWKAKEAETLGQLAPQPAVAVLEDPGDEVPEPSIDEAEIPSPVEPS